MFIPQDCEIWSCKEHIYGYCNVCNSDTGSRVYQFEDATREEIRDHQKAIDDFNGFASFDYNDFYNCKHVCVNCLETTFQNVIVARINKICRRINK